MNKITSRGYQANGSKQHLVTLFKRLLALACLAAVLPASAQLKWPGVTQQTKPWARWWWHGSAVNKQDLTANLQDYKAAGLGGLEVTPIYGVKGDEQQFISFLSPKWMQMLDHTLQEAKRLGLGIDLANGTGWPFGGPTTTADYASKTIEHKIYRVHSGSSLEEPVVYQREGLVRTANTSTVRVDDLDPDIAKNKDLQSLALDQVVFPGRLKLRLLMAYGDKGSITDLTGKVDSTGRLNWQAGNDNWTLVALFEGLHGKMVERAAPGGEGYAIDHFSKAAIDHYFQRFDTAFKGHDISYIRALFNDSYEVDDARGQANWTPGFLDEFSKRRGYDLKNYLPALFQNTLGDTGRRVLYDYRTTIGDLILEDFTREWKKWGTGKGAIIRNQSHGSPANLLDLYAAIDIPETEGDDILRYKFATSAAHVAGKPLASSESATWLNEHFLSSWGDVKKALDLFFLGGVNHIFYHGIDYSPKNEAWPGWLFYAAVHFQQTNPQWQHFHALNTYIARTQSFLQQGKPDNDILVYYPLADRYMQPEQELLQHFDGMGREFKGTDFQMIATEMQEKGYAFDFFSDKQLLQMKTDGRQVFSPANAYQVIVLPASKYLPLGSLQQLLQLAQAGATVLVYKSLPADVPGWNNLRERQATFQSLLKQLNFSGDGNVKKAALGKGKFLMGDDIGELLVAAGVRREPMTDKGLQCVRRKNAGGTMYFINNRTDKDLDDQVTLPAPAAGVAIFNPMTGDLGLADWQPVGNTVQVHLQLRASESVVVQLYTQKKVGKAYPYLHKIGTPQPLTGSWHVSFLQGGPVLPTPFTTSQPRLWTEQKGDAYTNFSGTARYTLTFAKPAQNAGKWLLDLGRVEATADIVLNGKTIATLIGPQFTVTLPDSALRQSNTLQVTVANLMANRIAYMDRNNITWKKFYNINMSAKRRGNLKNGVFDASSWSPLPSGLAGPVTLTPLR